MTLIEEKIHAHLAKSLDGIRHQLIHEQVDAALRFEITDERIEEREYDEQQRLRVDRIIQRRVFRGSASDRYAKIILELLKKGITHSELQSTLHSYLDSDLKALAEADSAHTDIGKSLTGYSEVIPQEKWPTLLCMTHDADSINSFSKLLAGMGFTTRDAGLLGRFGIAKIYCPPEYSFVLKIANLPEASFIADALTPVALPKPIQTRATMLDGKSVLGITAEMSEGYGKDASIAILDTGIDDGHPAFAGMNPEHYKDFTETGKNDIQGHGTHVASIAAGHDRSNGDRRFGIAPHCTLFVGKVLPSDGAGNLESILHGMAWAVFEKNADVLSLSLGDSDTRPNGRSIWTRACDEAFRHGTLVCVAAGNPYPSYPESVDVPADAATAITVGAIDNDRRLAGFSAKGSDNRASALFGKPNCVGPGVDIIAARSSQAHFASSEIVDALHVRMSGTSMATPAIAGCLALLKSKARSLGWEISPEDLRSVFYSSGRPVYTIAGNSQCESMEAGCGLPDMTIAFAEVERRAASSGIKTASAASETASSGEPIFCHQCGKRYLSKIGVFSPAWRCHQCGAPICAVCWQLGHRACGEKQCQSAAVAAPGVASMQSSADAIGEKGISPMSSANSPDISGSTFLNRFDWKFRNVESVVQPSTGEEFRLERDMPIQHFKRNFGEVAQFALHSGFWKKTRCCVAAVRLDQPPAQEDILRHITGPEGLDFQDEIFYCIGIYSPAPWGEHWKQHAEIKGNAIFYLVEKGEETGWRVFGPDGRLRDLFDPESDEEKTARAGRRLADCRDLIITGDQVSLEAFLKENSLNRMAVDRATQESHGRFRIIEYKGKSYIQRSILQEESCR